MSTLVVIGGGAAGFFGAIAAARSNPALTVILLEATAHPLEKVRISGGGRCNVTHACFDSDLLVSNYPRGSKELRGPLSRFSPRETIDWFASEGVQLKTEPDGRMFPVTDRSETIIDTLQTAARRANVEIRLRSRVQSIESSSDSPSASPRYKVRFHDMEPLDADFILLATGSSPQGYKLATSLGHSITPLAPSLFTFKITDPRLSELSGISFADVQLSLSINGQPVSQQRGPLLITHWGLSGPAVLKLSAWAARELLDAHYKAELAVNFAPSVPPDQLARRFSEARALHGAQRIASHPIVDLSRRYWSRIVDRIGKEQCSLWSQLSKKQTSELTNEISAARFAINGKGVFKEEFVTCGGVSLGEVNFKTMQSRRTPGLYFAGELLDIDGITGGFNFQNAWTTGWIAGNAIALTAG